jgi:hypothetical protein
MEEGMQLLTPVEHPTRGELYHLVTKVFHAEVHYWVPTKLAYKVTARYGQYMPFQTKALLQTSWQSIGSFERKNWERNTGEFKTEKLYF